MRNGAGKRTAIHYEAGSTSCRDKRTHKYKSSDTERSCLEVRVMLTSAIYTYGISGIGQKIFQFL